MENKGKRYVIGDLHGSYRAFKDLLDKVNFDYENDKLISLGDIVDGWSETKECLDLMMIIKNLVFIRGNHDDMAINYYNDTLDTVRDEYKVWITNGGDSTKRSLGDRESVDRKYVDFLETSVLYHVEDKGTDSQKLFVHAGVPMACCKVWGEDNNITDLDRVGKYNFLWDRDMAKDLYINAKNPNFTWGNEFEKIYIGHTPTTKFNDFYRKPQYWGNVWLMDTCSAFTGKVSIMDIDTEEIWQSKVCRQLYPDEAGRNRLSWNREKRFG
jgi:serine/threonine protein phosphatase 1